MCFGGDGGAGEIARSQRADEVARQARIQSGMARIASIFDGPGGFGEDYYAKRAQQYSDYAVPQLDRSYGRAKDQMIFALDRSGLLRSQAGIDKNAELSGEFDQSRLDIANKAQTASSKARSDVEGTRASLVSQLNATGDDQAAANAAMRQATALNSPEGFSPMGELFANFTQGLAAIGSNARNDYGGFSGGGGGLFNNSSSSSRVVRG